MSFRTVNGTAKAGEDYVAKTGTLTYGDCYLHRNKLPGSLGRTTVDVVPAVKTSA